MDIENMKNMIVLKNLPSNIVDEAIVILKPNIKLKSLDVAENKKNNNKTKKENRQNSEKYIINEAEMVVGNYLSKLENNRKKNTKINKKIEIKCKRLKMVSIFLGIMFFISMILR